MKTTASGVLIVAAALARVAAGGTVVYVDDGAAPGGDGSSWSAAHRFLQDALGAAAAPGSGIAEIRVAQGTYTADRDGTNPAGTGHRAASFQLIDGVAVIGGYAGPGAPDPDARNVQLYPTILSGDLAGNDIELSGQCCGLLAPPGCANEECRNTVCTQWWSGCCNTPTYWSKVCSVAAWSLCDLCGPDSRAENAYHVVTGSGTGTSAVLDGFTIRAGHADGPMPHDRGAGMLNEGGSPALVACTFAECAAVQGGGMYNSGSDPVLTDCVFQENLTADPFVADNGGAMYNLDSDPILSGCTFTGNFADRWGAAIYNNASSPTLTDCLFEQNFAALGGGGLANEYGSAAVLTGCVFQDNWANAQSGGSITSDGSSHLTVTACSFFDNFGVSTGGIASDWGNRTVVRDCVFLGNEQGSGSGSAIDGGTLTIVNCTFDGNENPAAKVGSNDLMVIEECSFLNGGVAITNAGATLHATNCTFMNFESTVQAQYDDASTLLTDCTFTDCIRAVGVLGGEATLVHCLISNCSERAVTVSSGNSIATLVNCSLVGNQIGVRLNAYGASALMVNCLLIGNGHAVLSTAQGDSTVDVRGCTLYGNTQGIEFDYPASKLLLRNSIVWQTPMPETGIVDAAFSDIQGGWPGPGNIDADPLFVGSFLPAPGSPCIDAGHNWLVPSDVWDLDGDGDTAELSPVDLDGGPRFTDSLITPDTGCGSGAVVDMGALETPGPAAEPVVYLDMNGDGVVDDDDLLVLLGQYGQCPTSCCLGDLDFDGDIDDSDQCIFVSGPCPADIDGSGDVGVTDMWALLMAWGTNPVGPPDLNCDLTVGIGDLLALFSQWGACP